MAKPNRIKLDVDRILKMREDQFSWKSIARYFGASMDTVRALVDPVYKSQMARMRRKYEKSRNYRLDHKPHHMGGDMPSATFRVPESVLAERERVTLAPLTINQAILGDPPPGRSALDKRRPHVVVDNSAGG